MPPLVDGLLCLIGGLGLFLYAISRFGDGVQKMAGEKIRTVLEAQARQPFSSIVTGMGMGAALQNNFLTFGMISGLINAGLLGILPALCIMFGVNIGMTVTAQIMSLNIETLVFAMLFIGYFLFFYGKHLHYLGQVIFTLALMYLGFRIFHQAFLILTIEPQAVTVLKLIFLKPWLGFLLGLSAAALLRSSNTVVVVTQGIIGAELGLGFPDFLSGVIAVIIGANVGTTFINMILGLDRLPAVKKANWLHFTFNLTTALLWLLLMPVACPVVQQISLQLTTGYHAVTAAVFHWSPVLISENWFNIWEMAMAHTLFNLSVILLWFPLTLLAFKLKLPILNENTKLVDNEPTYLDRRALHSPALALILAGHELNQMAALTLEMVKAARLSFLKGQLHLVSNIDRDEDIVDDLQEQVTFYLSALLSQNSLTESQSRSLAGLLHIASEIERVADHATSIARLAEKKHQEQLPFSDLALNEIELFFSRGIDLYGKAVQALREDNPELAKQIIEREENIDKLEEELRQNHIHRLNQGKCWPGSGVVYHEMLSNLQRITAHAASIAVTVIEEGEAK